MHPHPSGDDDDDDDNDDYDDDEDDDGDDDDSDDICMLHCYSSLDNQLVNISASYYRYG